MIYIFVIVAIVAVLLYFLWPTISPILGMSKLREFSREQLREYDGESRKEIYIGCKGEVFDVTKSQSYKPGATYHVFAGRDATVGLAKMSLDPVDLESSDMTSLKESDKTCLDQWYKQFKDHYKYPVVGRIVDSSKSS